MEIFQLELPRIFAEHLNSEELMKRHMAELQRGSREGSYEWDPERQAIIRITYHSAYGDSVDERRNVYARLGTWVVWSSAEPKNFHYTTIGDEAFTEEHIPSSLLKAPLIPQRVTTPAKRTAEERAADQLW